MPVETETDTIYFIKLMHDIKPVQRSCLTPLYQNANFDWVFFEQTSPVTRQFCLRITTLRFTKQFGGWEPRRLKKLRCSSRKGWLYTLPPSQIFLKSMQVTKYLYFVQQPVCFAHCSTVKFIFFSISSYFLLFPSQTGKKHKNKENTHKKGSTSV